MHYLKLLKFASVSYILYSGISGYEDTNQGYIKINVDV